MKLILVLVALAILFENPVNGWRRRRRRRRHPPPPRNCQVGQWSSWSSCSNQCGTSGTQRRTRSKTVSECCGGSCNYQFSETRACNRGGCKHGGTPTSWGCSCTAGWTGTCCEKDKDECLSKPCQHKCHNTVGSFTCSCRSCYTKSGTKCYLRHCKIGGVCYNYESINPSNKCQDCQSYRKTSWTNNDALSCSDGNLCTRNDRCRSGRCQGTLFSCKSCQKCNGRGCRTKPGFCLINGNCYKLKRRRCKVIVVGSIRKNAGKTVMYVRNKRILRASWPQLVNADSGMKKYQWAVSEENVKPTLWRDVPGKELATQGVFRPLSLKKNKKYRLTIRGVNDAGLHTHITSPTIILS